jgi:hypothetical protein
MNEAPTIVVAVTTPGPDAAHVVALLAAHGIAAVVEESGAAASPESSAEVTHRAQVRVAPRDAAKARRCLEQSTFAALTTPVSVAEKRALRERELTKSDFARYAFRSALFGVLFWPFQIYTVYLLLALRAAPGKLSDGARRERRIATVIVSFMGLGSLLAIVFMILAQRAPESDLVDLPRPDILCGDWEGDIEHDDPEQIHVKLHLAKRGGIRYEESGDHEAVCIGTWAYTNNLLYVRFTSVKESKAFWRPLMHEELGFQVVRVDDASLILRSDAETLYKLRRQPRKK